MTIEQVLALARVLGLIDLGEARTYLDEEGQIEAILVMTDVQESDVATSLGFPNLYEEGRKPIPERGILPLPTQSG